MAKAAETQIEETPPPPASDVLDRTPLANGWDDIAHIDILRADGQIDAAEYPALAQALRDQADLLDPQTGQSGETPIDLDVLAEKIAARIAPPIAMIPEPAPPPNKTPVEALHDLVQSVEDLLNTEFRKGGDAIASLHNGFVGFKRSLPAKPG